MSGITKIFSPGSSATPPAPPPIPTSNDAANSAAAMAATRKAAANEGGLQSTILTGGSGDTSKANVAKKTLLGS